MTKGTPRPTASTGGWIRLAKQIANRPLSDVELKLVELLDQDQE
jgi:hypothetical protein